jgi:hypothetical protein
MVQITIEYMIMMPILIMQIFLFPLTVSLIMDNWADSRRTIALEETAGHVGSLLQQIHSSLGHASISTGNITNDLDISPFIEGYAYVGNATLQSFAGPNSTKTLDITLRLLGTDIRATASVKLEPNVEWDESSSFMSNSTYASVTAEKYWNGTESVVRLSFKGDS